jgi:hypothetical protein
VTPGPGMEIGLWMGRSSRLFAPRNVKEHDQQRSTR